jgi:hypothetical protein
MKIKPLIIISFLAFFGTSDVVFSGPADTKVDHSSFGNLLKRHVIAGRVDYNGFKADNIELMAYLSMLSRINPNHLPRAEQIAFYINLYNAWTIHLVLTRYPNITSIKDLGSLFKSPWKKRIVNLFGDFVSLDHIEHEVLRPKFQDPRIHFAINCASKGCPPLLNEPYTGAKLETQLRTAAKEFINDPNHNYIGGDVLYVSRIFKWFRDDFGNDLIAYLIKYADRSLNDELNTKRYQLKIKFMDYDWSLNDMK